MSSAVRERPCAPVAVPPGLSAAVSGSRWSRNLAGRSGGAVWRLPGRAGAPDLYLKTGRGPVAHALAQEFVRLRWLACYLPVPEVVHFEATPAEAWLLTAALPGCTAFELLTEKPAHHEAVVDAAAGFLRKLHAIPVEDCPFAPDHLRRLPLARAPVEAGMVDEADFDDERRGWTAGQVLEALEALLPLPSEPVVTHGDVSLDNLLIEHGAVTGCIDLGRLGVADRWQDLAILWNDLSGFGPLLEARALARYGLPEPDETRLRFHLLLDELF